MTDFKGFQSKRARTEDPVSPIPNYPHTMTLPDGSISIETSNGDAVARLTHGPKAPLNFSTPDGNIIPPTSSGDMVPKAYLDQQLYTAKSAMEEYVVDKFEKLVENLDARVAAVAESRSDSKANSAIHASTIYTNRQFKAVIASAVEYANNMLLRANIYTDQKLALPTVLASYNMDSPNVPNLALRGYGVRLAGLDKPIHIIIGLCTDRQTIQFCPLHVMAEDMDLLVSQSLIARAQGYRSAATVLSLPVGCINIAFTNDMLQVTYTGNAPVVNLLAIRQ
jgi:hypothetical protein